MGPYYLLCRQSEPAFLGIRQQREGLDWLQRFWGPLYSTKGDRLSFTSLEWTEVGFPTDELLKQETVFHDGLVDVETWAVSVFKLTLMSEEGTVLHFKERR